MISLTCTHCQTLLSMDDAFAGGVCRCQFCGTIQTVPSNLKGNADEGVSQAAERPAAAKALYRKRGSESMRGAARGGSTGSALAGSGLDEIADIVASSGLAGSGLTHSHHRKPEAPVKEEKERNNLFIILVAAGSVIAILIIVIVWQATRSGAENGSAGNTPPGSGGVQATTPNAQGAHASHSGGPRPSAPSIPANPAKNSPTPPAVVAGSGKPSFMGTDLSGGNSVVYLLDRGNATGGTEGRFDTLKQVVMQSIQSLGAQKKFAVVFWNNDSAKTPDVIYPSAAMASANAPSIAECAKAIDPVYSFGQSDVTSALKKAIALKPSVIVLVTGKALEDDFSESVLGVIKSSGGAGIKIDAFSLGADQPSAPLSKIANQTGGTYRDIPDAELRAASPE